MRVPRDGSRVTDLSNPQVMQFTTQCTWRDGLDIGVVALVFYPLLLFIHGTRALQILGGVAILVATPP